jgi:hypothetical protein
MNIFGHCITAVLEVKLFVWRRAESIQKMMIQRIRMTQTRALSSKRNVLVDRLQQELADIDKAGTYKHERVITSPQGANITVQGDQKVLNFCANNYLGLSNHPQVVHAATEALQTHGFGLSSVRFICGTQVSIEKNIFKIILKTPI